MKTDQASINIKATPEKIWSIITDGPNYPAWDKSADRIEGRIEAGGEVTADTKRSTRLGVFTGVRTVTLAPKGDGTVDFTIREDFSGPLLGMMQGSLPDVTQV